jgi:hypothetical protein
LFLRVGVWLFLLGAVALPASAAENAVSGLASMLPGVCSADAFVFWRAETAQVSIRTVEAGRLPEILEGIPGIGGDAEEKTPQGREEGAKSADVRSGDREAALSPARYLKSLSELARMVDETALLFLPSAGKASEDVTIRTTPELYMACYVDREAFERKFAENGSLFHDLQTWDDEGAGDGASSWVFSLGMGAEKTPRLYMTGEAYSDRHLLLLSSRAEGVAAMRAARDGEASGLGAAELPENGDFLRMRLAAKKAGLPASSLSVGSDPGRTRIRIRRVRAESLPASADVGASADKTVSADGAGSENTSPPHYAFFAPVGRGEVALYLSLALSHAGGDAVSGAIDAVFGIFDEQGLKIPRPIRKEILSALRGGRISFFAVQEAREISNMYLLMEAPKDGTLDGVYRFVGLAPSQPLAVPGWDEAFFVSVPSMPGAVAARRPNSLLLGVGASDDFALQAHLPPALEAVFDPAAPTCLSPAARPLDLFVAPKIAQTVSGGIGKRIFDALWKRKHKLFPSLEKLDHMGAEGYHFFFDGEQGETRVDLYWKSPPPIKE